MTAVMLATPFQELPDGRPSVPGDLTDFFPFLNRLRFLAQRCRSEARLDLGKACAAIHACPDTSLDAAATALIRVVSEAVEGRVQFLAPGAQGMSWDEEWLVRTLDRAAHRDTASVEFLLRRRVARRHHHAFRSIVRVVAGLMQK